MHEKCIILRFEIVVFSVMGPYKLNGKNRRFGLNLLARVHRPKIPLQNIHNRLCTRLYGVLTKTTFWILTAVTTSNTVPKIMNWNIDGNVTLGNLNYTRAVYIFTLYLISHTFSTNCIQYYILRLKYKIEEINHFHHKHTIYDQDH